ITGSPTAIGLIATLWPEGMRSTVVTPSATTVPGGKLARAISTPSAGCRRMTGLMVMGISLGLEKYRAPDAAQREAVRCRSGAHLSHRSQASGSRLCEAALACRIASGTRREHQALPPESLRVALTC